MNIKYNIYLQLKLFIFSVCLLLFAACSTTQTVRYTQLIDKKFEPAAKDAEITKLPAEQLSAQGYVKIGEIYSEQVMKECYDSVFGSKLTDCSEHTFPENPTQALQKEAAQKGGHVVLLSRDNDISDREATKESGVCERERTETQYVNRPVSTAQGYKDNYVYEKRIICDKFKQLNGIQTVKISSGSVWRKNK
ncbi:MAG: hypothetical protein V1874_16870 [Spirochaetota bacterium]